MFIVTVAITDVCLYLRAWNTFGKNEDLRSSGKQSQNVWPSNMGPIACSETSVTNYHYTLRNIPEERRSRFHRSGSLKSSKKEGKKKKKKERTFCGQQLKSPEHTHTHTHTHTLTRDQILSYKVQALNSALSGILILGSAPSMNVRPSTSTEMCRDTLLYWCLSQYADTCKWTL